jgi:hypothetical protein
VSASRISITKRYHSSIARQIPCFVTYLRIVAAADLIRLDDKPEGCGCRRKDQSQNPCFVLSNRYGPYTTCYNRFNRWRKAGIWDQLMDAITKAYETTEQDAQRCLCGSDARAPRDEAS